MGIFKLKIRVKKGRLVGIVLQIYILFLLAPISTGVEVDEVETSSSTSSATTPSSSSPPSQPPPEPEQWPQPPLLLGDEESIRFWADELPRFGINNPNFWTENNERSTSANYTLWKEADVYLVDWPGNITIRDPNWPLLRWPHARAKYRENHCCEFWEGIEMRAYAYRYVYLTWGPRRFTLTFSPPLTVPATLFNISGSGDTESETKNSQSNSKPELEILASDFGFVQDALIIAAPEKGVVIRVYGLAMAFARFSDLPLRPLQYALAKGISSPVDKIVTQYCCILTDDEICPHGETVVAYREHSSDFRIFISTDGAENFKLLEPQPSNSKISASTLPLLHSVISYPDIGKVILVYGETGGTEVFLEGFSLETGQHVGEVVSLKGIQGYLQAQRIGEEMSLILWDDCNVWYSLAEGRNLTKAIHYVHGYLKNLKNLDNWSKNPHLHYILPKYCKFGRNSSLAVSKSGKLALLDSDNLFHLGVDTKSEVFQLAALMVDMSLVLPKHRRSIVPHFDHSQHPKLLYPPRFLEVPDKAMIGANYSQRLAVRLLPKTVFPTEFITVFYNENAQLPTNFKNFALRPCQTSSISVNRSISQKPKVYIMRPHGNINFTIRFKSKHNSTKPSQLHYEPQNVNKFLHVKMRLKSIEETGPQDEQFWMNYEIVITSRSLSAKRRIFTLNFFTFRTIRCNFQPSNQVYVKIDENFNSWEKANQNEHEMSVGSFLKIDDKQTEYGTSYEASSCSSCDKKKGASESCRKKPQAAIDKAEIETEIFNKFGFHSTLSISKSANANGENVQVDMPNSEL